MPRSIWSGTITFGLVTIPVRMYSAIEEHKLHFHYLHRKDDSPIGYDKVCKKEGKSVPDDEIAKAFEIEKGEYVYVEDEDFAAAKVEGIHTIELTDFVPYDDIDPIYFEKTFYLGPGNGGEKTYALLAKAMENTGLAGIGKYVMRDKEHLGCVRIRDGLITLERMFFADEIRDDKSIKPSNARVGTTELNMAEELIGRLEGPFEPDKYKDTYTRELKKMIRRKQKGQEVHAAPAGVDGKEEAPDLIEALRASIQTTRSGKTSTAKKRSRKKAKAAA